MKISVLLADRGTPNPAVGTLNLLNVGWSITGLMPAPSAGQFPPAGLFITPPHVVAVFYELEQAYLNRQIDLVIELLTEDGQAVQLPGPAGLQPMRMRTMITVASPGGLPIGTPGTGNTMLDVFPGLPLAEGAYVWRATIANQREQAGEARFNVRAAPIVARPQFGTPAPEG